MHQILISDLINNEQKRTGILLCGHGSRNRLAVKEFAELASMLQSDLEGIPVQYGYLEFARPIITEALDRLRELSVERVIAIPVMLFAAGHAKNDIPAVLNAYSLETGLLIDYARELGINNFMIGAAGSRVKDAIDKGSVITNSNTLLVVVGRGSKDPDANSNVAKITRLLVEAFGFGWGETLYSGVTFPLVEPGLRHLIRLGFKKIVVFPYFLFSGVLVSRIKKHTEKVAADFPQIEFINASYLGSHPFVLDTLKDRIQDVLIGNNTMNCSLCKYRSPFIGFESEVGLKQQSHHHHVEGLEESCKLCETECTGDCELEKDVPKESSNGNGYDHHNHSHYPYPHENHPLGPVTLSNPKSKEK